MTHIELTDITSTRWIGDSSDEELTPSDRETLAELLSNFKELNYLKLEIDGSDHYFNPAHVVAVSIYAEN